MKKMQKWFFLIIAAGGIMLCQSPSVEAMLFGKEDCLAPIITVEEENVTVTLYYHYQVHAFILPYWVSYKGYTIYRGVKIGKSDMTSGDYYSIGKSLSSDIQKILGFTTSTPAVPWGREKMLAYGGGYFIYMMMGLGIISYLIEKERKKRGKKKLRTQVINRWNPSQRQEEKFVVCPECSAEIPLESPSCLHCGHPNPFQSPPR